MDTTLRNNLRSINGRENDFGVVGEEGSQWYMDETFVGGWFGEGAGGMLYVMIKAHVLY